MDLLPPIAAGDLDRYSVAEVVAAAFRANATGTISIEQGAGESRIFLRYGIPCGVTLYRGFQSLGEWLLAQNRLTAEEHERTLTIASETGRKHGEVLVSEGLLTDATLLGALLDFHRDKLQTICLDREGRYELRGWERPPEWTSQLAFDPLRAVVWAFQQDELFDRREKIVETVGGRKIKLGADWESLTKQLQLDPPERRSLNALGVPRPAKEIGAGLLEPVAAEAFVAAALLLGIVEEDDGRPMGRPLPERTPGPRAGRPFAASPLDTQGLLSPAESSIPPGDGPLLRAIDTRPPAAPPASLDSLPERSLAVAATIDDAMQARRPSPASHAAPSPFAAPSPPPFTPPHAFAAAGATPFGGAGNAGIMLAPDPFAQLEAPLPGALLGATEDDTPPPAPTAPRTGHGDVDFDGGDDAPLELDLQRAPKEFARARLEQHRHVPRPTEKAVPARPDTRAEPAKVETPRSEPAPARVRKPPPLERAVDPNSPDYNPFAVQLLIAQARGPEVAPAPAPPIQAPSFAPPSPVVEVPAFVPPPVIPAAPPAVAMVPPFAPPPPRTTAPMAAFASARQGRTAADLANDDLEDRLERALNDPTPLALDSEDVPPAEILGPAGTVPSPPLAPDDSHLSPPQRTQSIMEGIAELVDANDDDRPARPVPPAPAQAPAPGTDNLALAAALEAEMGRDGDAVDEILEVSDPTRPLMRQAVADALARAEEEKNAPELEPLDEGAGDAPKPRNPEAALARRRLLAKSFKNLPGTVFHRPDSAAKPEGAAKPAEKAAEEQPLNQYSAAPVDEALARDVLDRVRRLKTDDHFTRLGIPRTAETEEVRTAFIGMAKRFHPDRMTGTGQMHLVDPVRELFAAIKESYDLLADPATRARYRAEIEARDAAKPGGVTKRDPEEGKNAFRRGQAALRRKAMREAEAEFYRAVQLDPAAEYMAELAWTMQQSKERREEAKDEIRDLLKRIAHAQVPHENGYRVLARFAKLDKELEAARKYWRKVQETSPKDTEAAMELRLLEKSGTPEPDEPGEGGVGGFFKKFRKK